MGLMELEIRNYEHCRLFLYIFLLSHLSQLTEEVTHCWFVSRVRVGRGLQTPQLASRPGLQTPQLASRPPQLPPSSVRQQRDEVSPLLGRPVASCTKTCVDF